MPGGGSPGTPEDLEIDERKRLLEPAWPRAAFIEHKLAGDPTNWRAADQACVEAMTRSAALRITERPAHEIWICERDAAGDHSRNLRTAELRAATRAQI